MEIKNDQKLSNYTTIGIGGVVKYMIFPSSGAELIEAIDFCISKKLDYFILAGGSNTVFSDDVVYEQAVINLCKMVGFKQEKGVIKAGPGFVLQDLVDYAQKNNLVGVTGLNRVPGTIGGAVIGNAGAYGCEICEVVKSVDYIDINSLESELKSNKVTYNDYKMVYSKLVKRINGIDCQFGYRNSYFKSVNGLVVTEIQIALERDGDFEKEKAEYDRIAEIRDIVYPKGFASPGSMFKNVLFDKLPIKVQKNIPPDWVVYGNKLPAGKLIQETIGLGHKIGGIGNREKHANILQNYGGGKSSEVLEFANLVKKAVKEKFGVDMELEIRIIPAKFSHFQH